MATSSSLDISGDTKSREDNLLWNICNHIHGPVDGLVVFDNKLIQKSSRVISHYSSIAPTPVNFLQCFLSFGKDQLDEASHSWHGGTSTPEGVTDLFLRDSATSNLDTETPLSNVQAV
jgi:hypothetical protein